MVDNILQLSSKKLSSTVYPVTWKDMSLVYYPETNKYNFMGPDEVPQAKPGEKGSRTEEAKIPILYYEQEDGSMVVPNLVGRSGFAQSNAGIDEHGNHFHSVDNPLTGETTTTLYNPETGERTVTVRPRRG